MTIVLNLERLIPLFAILTLTLFLMARYYINRHERNAVTIFYLSIAALLALLFHICRLVSPTNLTVKSIELASFPICSVFAYFGLRRYLNNEQDEVPYSYVFRTKTLYCTSFVLFIIITLHLFHQDSLNSFVEGAPFVLSWQFFISNLLYFILLGYLEVMIVLVYWKSIWRHSEASTFLVRRILCMLAYATGAIFNALTATICLFLLVIVGDRYLGITNTIFQLGRTSGFLFFVCGLAMPKTILRPLVIPIEHLQHLYRNRRDVLLCYLRDELEAVVPGIHRGIRDYVINSQYPLTKKEMHFYNTIRYNSEINDARRIIWSHVPRDKAYDPAEEAEYIYSLVVNKTMLTCPGEYRPAIPIYRTNKNNIVHNENRHNLLVAKHLKRRLSRSPASHMRSILRSIDKEYS